MNITLDKEQINLIAVALEQSHDTFPMLFTKIMDAHNSINWGQTTSLPLDNGELHDIVHFLLREKNYWRKHADKHINVGTKEELRYANLLLDQVERLGYLADTLKNSMENIQ